MKNIDIRIQDSISPWIIVNNRAIGMWWFDTKELSFDYSIGIKPIKCQKHEIEGIITNLFKNKQ